jgi:hypothetical protein
MNKEFENILDDCLERLVVRGETVEDCLNAYPQQADALKPLLQTALLTKNATVIEPRPEFKASARYQFRIALQETTTNKNRFLSTWRFRWATALTAILVMLMASGGLVIAAGTSMPDSPLYSVKLAVEQMQINLTFSDLGKANLYARFANRRVSEIMHMAQKGDASQVVAGTNLLGNQLAIIVNLTTDADKTWQDNRVLIEGEQSALESDEPLTKTPGLAIQPPEPVITLPPTLSTDAVFQDSMVEEGEASELLSLLLHDGVKNSAALRDFLTTVPESVQSALLEAIAVLEAGYSNAISAISE